MNNTSTLQEQLNEAKSLNESLVTYIKTQEKDLLNNIARELRHIYDDFKESENDDMDEILGEIYREKIKSIFKILGNIGVNM